MQCSFGGPGDLCCQHARACAGSTSQQGWIDPVLRVMMEAMEDKKILLPDGVIDLMTWGRMICETDKYKDAELSYFELVAMAKTDADVHSYLNFLLKRYGLKPGQAKHEKHTAGRDLAQFLQRYGWCGDNSDCTSQRRFK